MDAFLRESKLSSHPRHHRAQLPSSLPQLLQLLREPEIQTIIIA